MIPYIIGFFSGIIGGMGIGGGAILIPAFVIFTTIKQHTIQSINLLYFIPTAIIAIIIHMRNNYINFKWAKSIILFGILGSVFGSILAINTSPHMLKKFFGVFLLFMGLYEILRTKTKKDK